MATETILDVTQIEPRLKHPTIFDHYDKLAEGEGFIIDNDHDPKPLYYQLIGERGNNFSWTYLEQGPTRWKVRITRNNAATRSETVGQIAAKDIRYKDVFQRYGIDFCCGGRRSVDEACAAQGINPAEVHNALKEAEQKPAQASQDFNKWELDFLVDYIINVHHRYVKDNVEIIYGLAHKVANRHGDKNPELKGLAEGCNDFLQDLMNHMAKEEQILFPAIKEVVARKKDTTYSGRTQTGFISQPIMMMMREHDISGEDLAYFRKITNDYTLPAGACNSYTYLYEKMKEFEADLQQHIHLENNILFPKALALDKESSALSQA